MFGFVTFTRQGVTHKATLDDDRRWAVEPALPAEEGTRTRDHLDFIAASYRGPADGAFGPSQLRQATGYLWLYYSDVTTSIEPRESMPAGTIY